MIRLPAATACIVGLPEVMGGITLIVSFLTRIDSILFRSGSTQRKDRQIGSIGASIKRIEFKLYSTAK
jgi:hypothetical protein